MSAGSSRSHQGPAGGLGKRSGADGAFFFRRELEAGFSDWNDLASHDEVRKDLVAKELGQALQKAFALQDVLAAFGVRAPVFYPKY
jgi:hypothetical protein